MGMKHSARATRAAGTRRQTLVVSVAFIMVFGIAGMFVRANATPDPRPIPSARDGAELRTGTIQLAPDTRNLCRQLKFNNTSGELRDSGSAVCGDRPLAEARTPSEPRTSGNRLDLIRESFRGR